MKKRSIPGKSDLEAIRNQILDFACVAHDFRAETDEFLHNGDWNAKALCCQCFQTSQGDMSVLN